MGRLAAVQKRAAENKRTNKLAGLKHEILALNPYDARRGKN